MIIYTVFVAVIQCIMDLIIQIIGKSKVIMQKSALASPQPLSPIANINIQELEPEECSSDDPETENEDALEIQYTQPQNKGDFSSGVVDDDKDQSGEFVNRQNRGNKRTIVDENEQSMDRVGPSTKQMNKIQLSRRKNKRYQVQNIIPQYNTVQRFSNPSHSVVQSSSDSLFSNINPLKQSKKNLKLSRRESMASQSTQFFDSRKNINQPDQPCFQLSTQRFITFFLIYQIVIVFFLTLSSIQTQYFFMIEATIVLVLPSYFGIRCIWVATGNGEQGKIKEVSENDSEIIAQKQSRKIHNSYYIEQQKQFAGNWRNFPTKPKQKSSITPQKQQVSRLSFLSGSPQPKPHKYLLVIPYLHNNQLQHTQKCSKCPTSHTNTRIKHCNKCGLCHYGYDHYCLWLAVCIDSRNYAYFVCFVGILWLIGFVMLVFIGVFSWRWSQNESIVRKMKENSYFVLGVWCVAALESLLGLSFCTYVLVYHIWLNWKGVSTRQHFSGNIENPNNNIFCKSLRHKITQDYNSLFIEHFPKQSDSEPSATVIKEQSKP